VQHRLPVLLTGYRGAAALDVTARRDVLHGISALAAEGTEIAEIAEIDLNPLFVLEGGVAVADARHPALARSRACPGAAHPLIAGAKGFHTSTYEQYDAPGGPADGWPDAGV
jgi:hypothetical protein